MCYDGGGDDDGDDEANRQNKDNSLNSVAGHNRTMEGILSSWSVQFFDS